MSDDSTDRSGQSIRVFTPSTPEGVLEVVQWALSRETPLEIVGHGSRRGIGRPVEAKHWLDLSELRGVTLYEPEELVLSSRAGTPLAEIEELLARHGQQLAFEPCGPFPGAEPGKGTIGAVLATNLSGPRRLKAGAARDHILGIHAVSGRAEAFKSGGRVVKNVTGYDLARGLAGSWGTLAVFTDVTFKVLPAAETEATLAIRGLSDDLAIAAMALAMGSRVDVSGAAHLPEVLAHLVAGGMLGKDAVTLLRLEGFGPSVDYRYGELCGLLGKAGPVERFDAQASRALWRDIRDCVPFSGNAEKPVWRVSVAPSQAAKLALAVRMEAAAQVFYDWQGGLVWIRMEEEPHAVELRRLIGKFGGGHATLVRASDEWRRNVPVFQPQSPALAALSARLKYQFDHKGILNPGRMGVEMEFHDVK